jgi:hypothetical protein
MGWSLSWAALKGGNIQVACAALGLRATGKHKEIAESKIVGAQLPTGWCVIQFDRSELEDRELARLSRSGDVVCCFVEDHVMVSWASGWREGKKVWSVVHDCEKGLFHLNIKGEAPAELKSIAERLIAEQQAAGAEKADVDHVYEVPAELAKELTGYRHDQDMPGLTGEVFEILEREIMPVGSGRRWRSGYVWLFLSTPIAALLYVLAVAMFGERLPYWASADPKDNVSLALILHVLVCFVIVKLRKRRRAPSTVREG